MKGSRQFDLGRNHGAAGSIRMARKMAVLATIAALALASPPVFAQASPDAVSASATSADAVSASDTFAPVAGAADVSAPETFAPAAGAAIVAPDSVYALPPPDDGSLAVPTLSTADLGTDNSGTADSGTGDSGTADSAIEAAPATDGTLGDALPSGAPPIDLASPLGGIAPIAAADGGSTSSSHSGWDRVGDSESDSHSDSDDSGNSVLEVPQAVPTDASPAGGNGQSAQGGDSSPPDEIGSVNDYQDEQDNTVIGVYITPPNGPPVLNPPSSVGTFGAGRASKVPDQPNNGPILLRPGVGGMRPFAGGMNSAIMPTSPMYPRGMPMVQSNRPMVPRNSAPIPGGWWNRAR